MRATASDVDTSRGIDIVARGMAQWRRERPDIDCSGKAVVGRILRLQGPILAAVDGALEVHGLRYSEYAVLATLRVSGSPYKMSPSELVETLLLSSGGISNLLARLERKGWIRRQADPADGRAVIVRLLPRGKALVERAMSDHADVERRLVARLSVPDRERLAELLHALLVANESGRHSAPALTTCSDMNRSHA